MKKRLRFVIAIIAALLLIAAAPVSAGNKHGRHRHHPPSGDQVMVLNNNPDPTGIPDPGRYGCEEISWFGTIKINGKTFGMALYPVYGSGEPIYTYGEDWKIFTGKFKTDKDGKLKRCKPGRVLMSGYDEGYVDFSTRKTHPSSSNRMAPLTMRLGTSNGGTAMPCIKTAGFNREVLSPGWRMSLGSTEPSKPTPVPIERNDERRRPRFSNPGASHRPAKLANRQGTAATTPDP